MKVPKTVTTSLFALALFLFASSIPASAQQQTAPSLREPQAATETGRPWLGVTIQEINERLAGQMGMTDLRGVLVSEVADNSPADGAGVSLGDIIVRLNGRDVRGASDFVSRIQAAGVGSTVALEVNRAGAVEVINVTLEPMPSGDIMGRYMPGQSMGMMAMRGGEECPLHGQKSMGMDCPMGRDCPMGQMCPGKGAHACPDCPMGDACPGPKMGKGMKRHSGKGMMGGHMMGGPGMGYGSHGAPMYGKIMMAIKGLNLTPEQKTKAQAINADYKKRQIKAGAEARVAHIELHELLAADPVNMDKVRAKVGELAQKRAEMMLSGIRSLEEFKKLLSPEQKKSFRDMLAMDAGAAGEMDDMGGALVE